MNERANLSEITPGMPVFDALGAAVGPVESSSGEHFRVAGQELPASAIARIAEGAVHLHVARAVIGATSTEQVGATVINERIVPRDEDRVVVPLAEERLAVGKREVEIGEVLIRKRVVREERMVPTVFRREEVEIIRRGPGERWAPGAEFEGASITRIPLQGWEPVMATEAVTTREIIIEKARIAEEGHVTGTIRREHAEVDERYARVRPALEQQFAAGQGQSARSFAEAEPHVRAGFHAGNDPRYAGRDFTEVEPAVRQDYAATNQHDDDAWEHLRQEIRAGYEAARRQ